MRAPRLFSVAAGLPFMAECVRALMENRLIPNADMRDPAQLAACRFYVPSRRAALALRSAFVDAAPRKSAFLPHIQPLGEAEGDDFSRFAEGFGAAENAAEAAEFLRLPPAIGALERQALLARLIRPWRANLPAHIRALFARETAEIPAGTGDALWLARNLAELMDEMDNEGADPAGLSGLVPEDLAEWWQVTTEFLHCVFSAWPGILAERGQAAPAALRAKLLRAAAAKAEQSCGAELGGLFAAPKPAPMLVLGSTGSLPAAAEFIKAVACLPQGAAVLPGLDRDLDEKSWQELDKDPHDAAAFAHPQHMLKRLLTRLNAKRESIVFLGQPSAAQRKREKWISEIFRPAGSTDAWHTQRAEQAETAAGLTALTLAEAPTAREEALSIAIALRAALEEPNARAALITGDRALARRVSGELARFGLKANDSGGAPLAESEQAALLRLLLACIFAPGDAVALLALLKHPLTRLGFLRADLRRLVEQFEFFALRGGAGRISLAEAERFMAERLQKLAAAERLDSNFTAERMDESLRLAAQLGAAAAPLFRLARQKEETSLEQALTATVETLENFGRDEQGSLHRLYAGASGQKLISFCRSVLASRAGLTFPAREWPQILDALMAGETVEMRQNGHPRLFILGFFEARLHNFDTVIIGGLNEGTLPHSAKSSPFLSRMMKAALRLPPPEQKTGFAAHDMAQALSAKKLILTRALRVDNAPSVASRWLQRLQTVSGPAAYAAMQARGAELLRLAQRLDYAPPQAFAPRPCPKPPLALRPRRFSVTEIETLRRDPYAIYARRILRLKPLEPIIRDEDAMERGTLYHAVLAAFSQFYRTENIAPIKPQAEKKLLEFARAEFAQLQLPPDIEALWWPRFAALAPAYIDWESRLSPRRRYAETEAAETEVGSTGCFLRGRADRIDTVAEQGEAKQKLAEIIDFKTGSSPSKKQAQSLASPQLALESALLRRGAFAECGAAESNTLLYLRLKASGEARQEDIAAIAPNGKALPPAELAEAAWQQLERLLARYQDPNHGYLARALPPLHAYGSDYDHLARVFEWQTGSERDES